MAATITLKMRIPLAILLAVTSGFTDVISVSRWSTYASMMTGNLIKLGTYSSGMEQAALHGFHELSIPTPVFVITVIFVFVLGNITYHAGKAKSEYATTCVAFIAWTFIVTLEVAELLGWTESHIFRECRIYPLTFMFGEINAMTTSSVVGAPCTMCTGHLGVISGAIQKCLFGQTKELVTEKVKLSFVVVFSFLVGTLMGAFALSYVFQPHQWQRHFLCLPSVTFLGIGMVIDDKLSADPGTGTNPATTPNDVIMEDDAMDINVSMAVGFSMVSRRMGRTGTCMTLPEEEE